MNSSKIFAITLSLYTSVAFARVSDFNSLIDENSAAQVRLHQEIKLTGDQTRIALKDKGDFATQVVVDDRSDSINVRSKSQFLRFKKEVATKSSKSKDIEKRIANEFNSSEF
jgi:hypothetical protein